MKKTVLLIAAAIAMMSCGAMKGTSSQTGNAAATQSTAAKSTTQVAQTTTASSSAVGAGQDAGKALLALYDQFKADGNKYDHKNLNNIINSLQLVSACEGLKTAKNDKSYLKDFGKGMLVSAAGLVTEKNVNSVTNTLTDMVVSNPTVTSTASTAADKLQTAAQTASSISSILSMFAGK